MTKRKRTSHIPQGAPRKRRPVRRAFDSTTTAVETTGRETGVEENPVFVDDNGEIFTETVAVEASTTRVSQPARSRGRRVEQLRRSGGSRTEFAAAHISSAPLPVYERSFMLAELRRIGIISFALLGVIIALTFILR